MSHRIRPVTKSEGEEDVSTLGKKLGCKPEEMMLCCNNVWSSYANTLKPVNMLCDAGVFTKRAVCIWTQASLQWNKGGGEQ